jgi:hypothetical protein
LLCPSQFSQQVTTYVQEISFYPLILSRYSLRKIKDTKRVIKNVIRRRTENTIAKKKTTKKTKNGQQNTRSNTKDYTTGTTLKTIAMETLCMMTNPPAYFSKPLVDYFPKIMAMLLIRLTTNQNKAYKSRLEQ